MQKFLLLVSLLLYWVGCGSTGSTTQEGSYETLSDTVEQIKATRIPDHISVTEIAAMSLEGTAVDIVLDETCETAYIALGDRGVNIVDVSNPYRPVLIRRYETPQYINHVELDGNILYASYQPQTWSSYESVMTFDVTNPYDARPIGLFEENGVAHTSVQLDMLCYFVDREGFKIKSIEEGKTIGRYDLFDTAYALAVSDPYVFVANGRNGLTVLKAGEGQYKAVLED